MTDWSKSELQIIEWLGIDMWHQSLKLRVDSRHDKEFASMMAEVESAPKPSPKSNSDKPGIEPPPTTNKKSASTPQPINHFIEPVSEPVSTVNASAKALEPVEKFKLTATTKYRFPPTNQWGVDKVAKPANSTIKTLTTFDNDEGALDLLVLHWASKSPSEADFISKFSANCFANLGNVGIKQVLSIAFTTDSLHQTEPTAADKAALLAEIDKLVNAKSAAKILICGTALARLLLDSDCPLYKLRQQIFLFGQLAIPTAVSVDFASIGRVAKLKAVLWDDLKYLAKV